MLRIRKKKFFPSLKVKTEKVLPFIGTSFRWTQRYFKQIQWMTPNLWDSTLFLYRKQKWSLISNTITYATLFRWGLHHMIRGSSRYSPVSHHCCYDQKNYWRFIKKKKNSEVKVPRIRHPRSSKKIRRDITSFSKRQSRHKTINHLLFQNNTSNILTKNANVDDLDEFFFLALFFGSHGRKRSTTQHYQ